MMACDIPNGILLLAGGTFGLILGMLIAMLKYEWLDKCISAGGVGEMEQCVKHPNAIMVMNVNDENNVVCMACWVEENIPSNERQGWTPIYDDDDM